MSAFLGEDVEDAGSWLFLLTVLALAGVIFLSEKFAYDNQVPRKLAPVETGIETRDDERPRRGQVREAEGRELPMSDIEFQHFIREHRVPAGESTVTLMRSGHPLTLLAFGADGEFHPVNAYFLDYVPFRDERVWVPLAVIAQRLRYSLDEDLFTGFREVWQTSRQAYRHGWGDCEDHAVLLADWLAGMGHDARVVLGRHAEGGHAWVVLFAEGETYILEATEKRQHRRYPLASLLPDYRPEVMFNRDWLWLNEGTPMTTDYTGSAWRAVSRFEAVR